MSARNARRGAEGGAWRRWRNVVLIVPTEYRGETARPVTDGEGPGPETWSGAFPWSGVDYFLSSKRSFSMTLAHAAAKSLTNFS